MCLLTYCNLTSLQFIVKSRTHKSTDKVCIQCYQNTIQAFFRLRDTTLNFVSQFTQIWNSLIPLKFENMTCARAGWCGRNDKPRTFVKYEPKICYEQPAAARVDKRKYDDKRFRALTGQNVLSLIVEKRTARTWEMNEGDLCRIKIIEGPQVVDLNFWCKHQPKKERFYSGKTRQLHSSHLKVYDRLWSNLPYLRPMATMVADSINYGIDSDGASLHDVIGTRCDDYTYKLITGRERRQSCHSQLVDAVKKIGLDEEDVHDVWNVFMCTGFTRETNQYFVKPTPVKKDDYIEFIADMDLICALSSCPQGAVSKPVGEDVPEEECFPIGVEVFRETSKC